MVAFRVGVFLDDVHRRTGIAQAPIFISVSEDTVSAESFWVIRGVGICSLGSADMKRLTMNTRVGQAEWRATDTNGQLTELPLAIELKNFSIEEYPPKLMLIDNATGRALPDNAPAHLLWKRVSVRVCCPDGILRYVTR